MKKLLFITKSLLVSVMLCVGANAWGQTIAFSQDFTEDKDGGTSTDPTKYGLGISSNSYVNYTVTDGVLQCNYGGYTSGGRSGTATASFDAVSGNHIINLSYKWFLGNATGNAASSYTMTSIGNSSGNALEIAYYGSYNTNGHITVNGTEIFANAAIRGTTYTITATLNLKTRKITALNMVCSNATYSYTATGDIDFASEINSFDRFVFGNGQRQNWSNTSSIDDVSISYQLADGDYYLKNKETGAYFAVGCSWGTQAMTSEYGHRLGFAVQDGGKYHLNSYIYHDEKSTETRHYLNADFCDGAALGWTVAPDGEGYYTLNNGSGNLTAGAVGSKITIGAGTGDATKWQILTAAQRKAEIESRMASATSASGVDATFYITAPNFGYADLDDRAAWQGSPKFDGWDNKSSGRFWNGEKFSTTPFDVYQELTGLKPGAYKLTMKGFYRNGTTNDRNALLYANSFETPLVNIRKPGITSADTDKGFTTDNDGIYVPDSQEDAAKAFNNGYYDNELYFVVGDAGTLRIGVKKTTGAENDWAVFDDFQLTYYGTTVPATIGTYGYATFSSTYPVDFTGVEGLKAYKATSCDGSTVHMEEVTGTVAANTGLVLKGAADTYNIPTATEGTTPDGNLLHGCDGSWSTVSVAGSGTNYVLSVQEVNEVETVVWAPVTDGENLPSLSAGQAYLYVPGSSPARGLRMVFPGDVITGVESVEAAAEAAEKDGKFVENGMLVIKKNGKKFNAAGQQVK